tara:strand:+ start:1813 stop:2157 length:345 start_codon:yes stop_codon:yes gene_type:complete
MSDTPLPPPDELPILPNMDTSMELDLAIDNNGEIYVFYTKAFPEAVNWAEYDFEESRLYFISEQGRIQGLGLDVYKHMQDKIQQAHRIFAIHIENSQSKQIVEMPLVHQFSQDS